MQISQAAAMRYLVQMTGYEGPRSLEFLYHLVKRISPKQVLELGTGFGASAAYMASAIGTGQVITVDNYDGGYAVDPQVIKANILPLGLDGKIVFVKGDTRKARTALAAARIKITPELVFMDADHSYNGILAEYNEVLPLLPQEHVIVVDDLIANLPDLRSFMVDLMGRYEYCFSVKSLHWGMAVACTNKLYMKETMAAVDDVEKVDAESVRQDYSSASDKRS